MDEEDIKETFIEAYNSRIDNNIKEYQNRQFTNEGLLIKYYQADILELMKRTGTIEKVDAGIIFRTLDCITVLENGKFIISFLDK